MLLRPTPSPRPVSPADKKLAWHLELDPGKLAAPEGVEILAGNMEDAVFGKERFARSVDIRGNTDESGDGRLKVQWIMSFSRCVRSHFIGVILL